MKKVKCAFCGNETEYDVNIPIEYRNSYVEGIGQICKECDSDNVDNILCIPKSFILKTPNDEELGQKIRRFLYKNR